MKKICRIFILMILSLIMILPNISAIRTVEKNILPEDNNEGLVDNLIIVSFDTTFSTIILNILNPSSPQAYLIYNFIENENFVNVTVEQQFKLENLKGDKTLYELNITSILDHGQSDNKKFHEQDFSGYLFGFITAHWTVKVLEDNSSVTYNLLGIVFKYGTHWFNSPY